MQFRSRSLYLLFSCFILLIFSYFCSKQRPQIKIGLAINLSGRGGEAGEHIRNGALLAVDEINHSGGINGQLLNLIIRDDANSADCIYEADNSLIKEGVVAIVGHSLSANTLVSYPFVTSHNTLLITAYASTTELSQKDDLFFRTTVDCNLFGRKMATLLVKEKSQNITLLMDMTNAGFVEDYAKGIKKHFNGTISEVKFESREQADWGQIIVDLLTHEPDTIILLTEASMTGVALQKLKSTGYSGSCIASIWAQSPGLMRYAGDSAEGLRLVTFINPDNTLPEYLSFSQRIKQKFSNHANARSTRAYELIMILADALKRCPEINSDALKKALLAGEYDTLMGHLRFDEYGDVERPVYEVIVRDHHFHNNGEL